MEQGDFASEKEQNGPGFLSIIQLSNLPLILAVGPYRIFTPHPAPPPPSPTKFQPSRLPSRLHIHEGFGLERF